MRRQRRGVAAQATPTCHINEGKFVTFTLQTHMQRCSTLGCSMHHPACLALHLCVLAGVLVITAAGNYQDSLLNYVPAACPAVAAVTAVDPSSRAASPFSNYLPAHAPAADKARVMAAPGSGVMSTMSIQREPSRYR